MLDFWKAWRDRLSFVGIVSLLLSNHSVNAQVAPDSSLGTQVNGSAIAPCTGTCTITNGTARGSNLFHSFQQFSLPTPTDNVTFQSGAEIRNIFARVTGRSDSFINGKISTDSGNVNLYLINPNGIRFGSGAELAIGSSTRGSFVATTLDAILFPDGSQFSATNPGDANSLLTIVGDPSGFIASQRQPAAIQTFGSSIGVYEGQSLILLGGNLSFDSEDGTSAGKRGRLNIRDLQGGQITFGSVAGAGTVQLIPVGTSGNLLTLNFPNGLARGDVTFRNRTEVNVVAESGGDLSIYGRNINVLSGSQLVAGIGGGVQGTQAGDITLDATETVTVSGIIEGQNAQLFNGVNTEDAVGNAGNILITARSITITEGGEINTSTFGEGKAGNIIITAPTVLLDAKYQGFGIFSNMNSPNPGAGGNISITSDTLTLKNGSNLNVATTGEGNAGSILIDTRSLSVTSGAQISATTSGGLDAGNIVINARETVQVDGFGVDASGKVIFTAEEFPLLTQITNASLSDRGQGGDIRISTGSLVVTNGAELTANTFAQGNAGNIFISARDGITLTGQLDDENPSGLFATTFSAGQGGNITTTSRTLQIQDKARLAVGSRGEGPAGEITLQADRVKLSDRGSITATTFSSQGGNITLNLRDSLLMRRNSEISTSAGLAGAGGNGGNITINAPKGFLIAVPNENSDISANAFQGSGGKVTIAAVGIYQFIPRSRADLVQALNTENPAELDPTSLPTNDITAISQGNPSLSGTVTLNTPDVDPNRGLVPLPTAPTDPSNRLDQSCAPNATIANSRFTVTGRGGLPSRPDDGSITTSTLSRLATIPAAQIQTRDSLRDIPTDRTRSTPSAVSRIVEAQAAMRLGNGHIRFFSQAPSGRHNAAHCRMLPPS
jgi:filamentous hemagglutinin family protein